MSSGTFNILAGNDDGHINTFPQYLPDANQTEMGARSGYSWHSWFRFDNVTIEAGSTITLAKITFVAASSLSGSTCNLNIYFEDSADPNYPSSAADYNGRSVGSPVAWNNVGAWTLGSSYETPELKDILQAVIDLAGWNSGQAVQCLIKDNGSSSSAYRWPASYENSTYTEAQLYVEWDPPISGEVDDNFTINDQVDAYEISEIGYDNAAINDSVDADAEYSLDSSDNFTINDLTDAGFLVEGAVADNLTINDSADAVKERFGELTDSFTIDDSADAFNWIQWLRENYGKYAVKYYLTLTGDADDLSDLELPHSSIQSTKRNGSPTSLSVIIPGFQYSSAISARSNGDLRIEMAYIVNGVESFREQIIEVDLDNIRTDEGAYRRSITLSGSRTVNYGSNLVALENPIYKYVSDGKIRYRFLTADPWLNPGDVVRCRTDEFVAAYINYVISDRFRQMEVSEV